MPGTQKSGGKAEPDERASSRGYLSEVTCRVAESPLATCPEASAPPTPRGGTFGSVISAAGDPFILSNDPNDVARVSRGLLPYPHASEGSPYIPIRRKTAEEIDILKKKRACLGC